MDSGKAIPFTFIFTMAIPRKKVDDDVALFGDGLLGVSGNLGVSGRSSSRPPTSSLRFHSLVIHFNLHTCISDSLWLIQGVKPVLKGGTGPN